MRINKVGLQKNVKVIIPAFNEENAVGRVVNELPKEWISEVIVVNNNSTDATSEKAAAAGATVLEEPIQGYGRACLKGIEYVKGLAEKPDIIVFGHSHLPMNEYIKGVLYFNPGSATDTVFAPYRSYGIIEIKKDGTLNSNIYKI